MVSQAIKILTYFKFVLTNAVLDVQVSSLVTYLCVIYLSDHLKFFLRAFKTYHTLSKEQKI